MVRLVFVKCESCAVSGECNLFWHFAKRRIRSRYIDWHIAVAMYVWISNEQRQAEEEEETEENEKRREIRDTHCQVNNAHPYEKRIYD